ncbi:DUF6397 family protein [Streptomyces caatingaensis]|uniref:DUF6397 family protein n=1 Tax=Streptomyces caatingaensis TaxID=1678637 RepID=UPI00069F3683|nr:DUF6397 family protein [Streptomyces caatingaensis]
MGETCVPVLRAARELGLKPGEFELAVQLGEVRTVTSGPGGPRRVPAAEVGRHAGREAALRARLRVVGTAWGAELAGVRPERFARLARCGLLTPVRFHLNRYRVVVWHYLATDVEEFAERNPELLKGPLPAALRAAVAAGRDERPANWRALRVRQLTEQAEAPWARAAATAAVLAPADVAAAVPDPAERIRLAALRPALTTVRTATPAGQACVAALLLAEDEEAARYREELAGLVERARAEEPVRVPAAGTGAGGAARPAAVRPGSVRGARVRAASAASGLLRDGAGRARRVLGRRLLGRVCGASRARRADGGGSPARSDAR